MYLSDHACVCSCGTHPAKEDLTSVNIIEVNLSDAAANNVDLD